MSLIRDKKHILIWNQTKELMEMENFIAESRRLDRSIVLSTEEFDSLTPEHIPLLRDYLKGFNVTIVMVYRELLSQILSNHFEENRFEHNFVRFSAAFSNYFFKIMDDLPRQLRPLEILSDYAAVFGLERVRVIDLVGTTAAGKDVAYVTVCEVAGLMCDQPDLFKMQRGNPSYSLIPSQVFSFYKNHVFMQRCVFCADTFTEYTYFANRYAKFIQTTDPPSVVQYNLTILRPYVRQVDSAFREKFQDVMLYSDVSANMRSIDKARTKELDFEAFVTNATWVEWIRIEYLRARNAGHLCNCSLHAVHGQPNSLHGGLRKAPGQNATHHMPFARHHVPRPSSTHKSHHNSPAATLASLNLPPTAHALIVAAPPPPPPPQTQTQTQAHVSPPPLIETDDDPVAASRPPTPRIPT